MLLIRGQNRQKTWMVIALATIAFVLTLTVFMSKDKSVNQAIKNQPPQTGKTVAKDKSASGSAKVPKADKPQQNIVIGEIKKPVHIDYQDLDKDQDLKTMMEERKNKLGIKKSLDMIVKSDESFIVGDSKVSMQTILEKAFVKKGEVFQEKILDSGSAKPLKIKEYGVYVVQPGDNIWNIHFRILRDYYSNKNIGIEEKADEPGTSGFSSGVGKILKFSETMVIIYNLIENEVTKDINLIEPLSKVIIYNMDDVFALLEEINFNNVDRIQFDGKNIWIPAKKF